MNQGAKLHLDRDVLLGLLRQMIRVRRFEDEVAARYREQRMPCPVHLCLGQEGSGGVRGLPV